MTYRVISPLVIVKPHGDYHYAGSIIPQLTPEQAEHFLAEGHVEKIEIGSEPVAGEGEPDAPADDSDPAKPAKVAPVEDWIAYAVSRGADPAEAQALTKPELQELYG